MSVSITIVPKYHRALNISIELLTARIDLPKCFVRGSIFNRTPFVTSKTGELYNSCFQNVSMLQSVDI